LSLSRAARLVLKLILDNFRPGDKIVEASSDSGYVMTQAFVSPSGERKLLLVNKRDREFEVSLPEAGGGKIEMIDLATGSKASLLSKGGVTWT
jgi:hypothetical protein